jgi:uncharacterized coiled-coil DUF342 family protein
MVTQDKYDKLHLMYEQLVAERDDCRSYKDKLEKKLEQSDKRIQELMEQLILLQRSMFVEKPSVRKYR